MLPDLVASIRTSFWVKAGLILWILLISVVAVRATLLPRKNSVYPAYHAAAQHYLNNEDIYNRHNSILGIDLFRYGPSFAAFMIPMTVLPEAWAGGLWRMVQGLGLLWIMILLANRFWANPNQRGIFFILCVPLSIGSLNNGQVNPMIVLSLGLGLIWSMEGRWWIAGMAISLAVFLKVFPLAVALLFVLVGGWRLAWGLVVGIIFTEGFAFFVAPSDYVIGQWIQWFELLGRDNRSMWPIEAGYRDGWLLLKLSGLTPPYWVYQSIQAGSGLALAVLVLGVYRALCPQRACLVAWSLGNCWMMVFGPTTESSTYTLLAPVLAFALLESAYSRQLRIVVLFIWSAGCLLFLGVFSSAFPIAGRLHSLGMQPIGAILLGIGLIGLLLSPRFKLDSLSNSHLKAENR